MPNIFAQGILDSCDMDSIIRKSAIESKRHSVFISDENESTSKLTPVTQIGVETPLMEKNSNEKTKKLNHLEPHSANNRRISNAK